MHLQVVIRVRPPLPRELEGYQPFQNTALVDPGQRKLTVSENAHSIQNGANASDIALVSISLMFPPMPTDDHGALACIDWPACLTDLTH